jgi:hypothetical protein
MPDWILRGFQTTLKQIVNSKPIPSRTHKRNWRRSDPFQSVLHSQDSPASQQHCGKIDTKHPIHHMFRFFHTRLDLSVITQPRARVLAFLRRIFIIKYKSCSFPSSLIAPAIHRPTKSRPSTGRAAPYQNFTNNDVCKKPRTDTGT